MLPIWALMAGASAIKAGVNWYSGQKQADRQRGFANKIGDLSQVTPNEREYMKRQREISEGGDPFQNQLMQEQMNRTMGNIRQTGAENLQRAEGGIIGQGMETSIVASEIRRKVNKDTMRSVAEQSRRITAENRMAQERTKRQAEERMYNMQFRTDDRIRGAGMQSAGIRAGIQSRGERDWNLLGSLAQTGIDAYSGYQGAQGAQSNPGMPWEGMNYQELDSTITSMPQGRFDEFYKGLDSAEQLKFMDFWGKMKNKPQRPKVPVDPGYGGY